MEQACLDSEHLQDFANWLRGRQFVKSGKAQESGLWNPFAAYLRIKINTTIPKDQNYQITEYQKRGLQTTTKE
ncbi:hypothetical protein ATN92_03440 [Companilactobacillus bobalius]|nr:hypothetical protein ATN92_15990 [Companilactobacillus bobalius]KAE9563797.1 hypothetical protein ATN92_03440 [Companilactobacillus bobalius]